MENKGPSRKTSTFTRSDHGVSAPAGLAAEQGLEGGQERFGDDLGALGCGMDAVRLDGVGDVDQVFVDHGNKGYMVLRS